MVEPDLEPILPPLSETPVDVGGKAVAVAVAEAGAGAGAGARSPDAGGLGWMLSVAPVSWKEEGRCREEVEGKMVNYLCMFAPKEDQKGN